MSSAAPEPARPVPAPSAPPFPEPPAPLVSLEAVTHAYARTPALDGVSLAVAAGEAVAVTGPSGCGKSTLLHLAAGLLAPQTGRVLLLGRDVRALTEDGRARLRRREAGIVLQYGQLVPDLPLLDNTALPLLLDGADLAAARARALDALERVGLADSAGAVPAEVSGGQAQRAAVARALITAPRVVFADEPLASLDPDGARLVLDLLLEVPRRGGALVLVTHDNTAAAMADREVRLRRGSVEHEAVLR